MDRRLHICQIRASLRMCRKAEFRHSLCLDLPLLFLCHERAHTTFSYRRAPPRTEDPPKKILDVLAQIVPVSVRGARKAKISSLTGGRGAANLKSDPSAWEAVVRGNGLAVLRNVTPGLPATRDTHKAYIVVTVVREIYSSNYSTAPSRAGDGSTFDEGAYVSKEDALLKILGILAFAATVRLIAWVLDFIF